ncbi:MAG: hypothetical protein HY093_04555 [Candidatus Liptonbacteria bacterium]|nr:hypothetical protein [Candidatus Liptonbacteria bacterium]
MAKPELLEAIKRFLGADQSVDSIKRILMGTGWKEKEIDEALAELGGKGMIEKQRELFRPRPLAALEVKKPQALKSKKIIFPVAVILAATAILAIAAYFFYFNDRSPRGIFEKAFSNLSGLKSARYDFKGGVNFKGDGAPLPPPLNNSFFRGSDFSILIDGGGNLVSGGNKERENSGSFSVAIVLSGGAKILVSADTVSLGGTFYFRVTRADGLENFTGSDFLKDKWVKVDLKEALKDFSYSSQGLYFLKFKQALPKEMVEGEAADHYQLELDQEQLKQFLVAAGGYIEQANLAQAQAGDLKGQVDQFLKFFDDRVLGSGRLEAWVSEAKKLPLRILVNEKFKDQKMEMDFESDLTFSNFNDQVTVAVPAEAMSMIELVKGLGQAADNGRIENLKKIQAALTVYKRKCGFYPGPMNCEGGFKAAPKSGDELIGILKGTGIPIGNGLGESGTREAYFYGTDGSNYFLGVTLNSKNHPAFKGSLRGVGFGINCYPPVYCVSSFKK